MSQHFYSIQLLDDLHNYFPELLYNPRRFLSVQDVLYYIRSVANVSPYTLGQQQYNTQQTTPSSNINQTYIPASYPIPPASYPIPPASYPIPSSNLRTQIPTTAVPNTIPNTIPRTFVTFIDEFTVPQANQPETTTNNRLINTLIGGLFGDIIIGNNNLNNFLNERVIIRPTSEEINNASSTFVSTRHQDDICAICQDNIETNQNVRSLTQCGHYFHQDCIDVWFRGNVHCPTCRHDIREVANINQSNTRNENSNPPPVPENYRRMNIRQPDII
jgi:hypothetical protein